MYLLCFIFVDTPFSLCGAQCQRNNDVYSPMNIAEVPGLRPNCVCMYLTENAENIPIDAVSALLARHMKISAEFVQRRFIVNIRPG